MKKEISKNLKILISYVAIKPLLDIYVKNIKILIPNGSFSLVFRAVLFKIVKTLI